MFVRLYESLRPSAVVTSTEAWPVASCAGGVTLNVARCSSVLVANFTGTLAGVALQPSGTLSRTVASPGPAKLCRETETFFGFASPKT